VPLRSPPTRMRIAVLVSGGGSNLQALLDHLDSLGRDRSGDVTIVISNRAAASALSRATSRGIETAVIPGDDAGTMLDARLDRSTIDLVVLAGYLKLVPAPIVRRFRGRMVNVHPALLPAFGGPGMFGHHVHDAVLAAGATVSGPTVHFVDEEFDRGPVIAQWPVPVRPDDTTESLAARVLRAEHLLLPRAVDAIARGAVFLDEAGRVVRPVVRDGQDGFHLGELRHMVASVDELFGDTARPVGPR
jgi:phosphoribosylglycinamide formyltransferase 1